MNTPRPSDVFPRQSDAGDRLVETNVEVDPDESTRAVRATNYMLGNPELPIADFRERIVEAVTQSQATVITAETGAGKSTQVPQFLAEAGHEVIVTQPRVVAARTLAGRVRDEVVAAKGREFKKYVGHRTARERSDDESNQILYVTDGLQQVRELHGRGTGKKQVLVLDEVHEWNENMEVLVAWAKRRMSEDPKFKVVTMSATMDARKLSQYFAADTREAPVIEVPGRTFEVKKKEGGEVVDETVKFARQGKNTLVFAPGKAEIDQVIAGVSAANIPGMIVLPLHGQMEKAEQDKVFAKYPGVKIIVATNVAETSITIPDIDAVVDSGLERKNEVRNGVEGLYLKPISRANCLQRAGRAGRTKEGEYVLAQLAGHSFVSMEDREPYGTPEILRTRLDGMVLRLAKAGIDASEMGFYHSKDESGRDITPEIAAAKLRLQKLGALREDDSITSIGRDMERMPVESHYARMMIEARKYSPEVQKQVAAMLAVQEAGHVAQFGSRNNPTEKRWRSLLGAETVESDMIMQLEVFIGAQNISKSKLREHDIMVKNYSRAQEIMKDLANVERLNGVSLEVPTDEQKQQLLRCILAGMADNLYVGDYNGYTDARGGHREISRRSMIKPGEMIVGLPFDLEIQTRRGARTIRMIESVTNVPSYELLREVAPQLFSESLEGYTVLDDGQVVEQWSMTFNGQATGEKSHRQVSDLKECRSFIIQHFTRTAMPYTEINDIVYTLRAKSGLSIPTITPGDVKGMLEVALPDRVLNINEAHQYLPEVSIDDIISLEEREAIDRENPDQIFGLKVEYDYGRPIVTKNGVMSPYSVEEILRAFDGCEPSDAKIGGKEISVSVERQSPYVSQLIETELKRKAEEAARMLKEELDARGREAGLPSNIAIYRRIAGATDNSMGWVVGADGALRQPDASPVDIYGRYENPDGTIRWDQVRPGELVLSWRKQDVISPHEFATVHLPDELTPEQLATVAKLQKEISESWSVYDNRKSDPRGDRSSPPVGAGWRLSPESIAQRAEHERVKLQLSLAEGILEDLSSREDLRPDHREEMVILERRIDGLKYAKLGDVYDFDNKVKSVVGIAQALKKKVDEWTKKAESATVTIDALLALKQHFGS